MIIYEDVFTGNEVFSDAYPCKLSPDGLVWEANGMSITIDNSIDDAAIGGNASAEDGDDGGADDSKETAINLVYAFKLKPYDIDKKQYTKYIKEYGKKLVEKLKAGGATDAELDAFKTKMATKCKEILQNFKDYDVYINEDYNEDGMLPLLNYREDGTTPYFTYFAAGVKGVKC